MKRDTTKGTNYFSLQLKRPMEKIINMIKNTWESLFGMVVKVNNFKLVIIEDICRFEL